MLDLSSITNEEVIEALRDLLEDGSIDVNTFYKGIISTASDYAKNGDILMAYVTLAIPPASYYSEIQLKQMAEDPLYAEIAADLAATLSRYNFDNNDLKYNQPPANA